MESVILGKYPQGENGEVKPIEWLVLERQGSEALLLSKYGLEARPYNDHSGSLWEYCSLRKWLNQVFYLKAFSKEERRRILPKRYEHANSPDKVAILGSEEVEKHLNSCEERVCLATEHVIEEIKKAYEGQEFEYACIAEDRQCTWWLRTPWDEWYWVAIVDADGEIFRNGSVYYYNDYVVVRPAIWVKM